MGRAAAAVDRVAAAVDQAAAAVAGVRRWWKRPEASDWTADVAALKHHYPKKMKKTEMMETKTKGEGGHLVLLGVLGGWQAGAVCQPGHGIQW